MALFQRFERSDRLIQLTQDISAATAANDESFITLVVGLGNIGKQYNTTRHNIGFEVLDALQKKLDFPKWQEKTKFKALISEDYSGGKKVILAKPTTFMNASGESLQALKDFYKLENKDIIVIQDEYDLPFGTVKLKQGGGSAGNNGLKSLISHIGDDFTRIRIGVKNELAEKMNTADFVLGKFSKEEQKQLESIIQAAITKLSI
ncbi:aminoacyl-tRNA hydrolase [Candidatus Saccharibacteria bacterium]|nr:aminoacyl-tRNA hydrolase [Candidatus Saccharibacteria bacterium]